MANPGNVRFPAKTRVPFLPCRRVQPMPIAAIKDQLQIVPLIVRKLAFVLSELVPLEAFDDGRGDGDGASGAGLGAERDQF